MRALKIIGILILVAAAAAGGCYLGFRAGSSREMAQEPSWNDQYASVLRTYIDPEYPDSGTAMFNIFDLDSDGSPELLVSMGDFHSAGGEIFTLYHGAVYYLGPFGSWGDFQFDPETGHIYSAYMGMGSQYVSIHQLIEGQVVDIVAFYERVDAYSDNPEDWSFEVDGEEVSQEEYNRAWEKYGYNTDDDFTARKYDVNEDEIARVLANY